MGIFLTFAIGLFQVPPVAPPPPAPQRETFENLKRAVAALAKSPSDEAKLLAQKLGIDVATMETIAKRDYYVPNAFLDGLNDDAQSLAKLAARPALDDAGLTALRGVAEDFQIKAQAVIAPIMPTTPTVIAQAPARASQPSIMPMPPIPQKTMPVAPSKVLPTQGSGVYPAAQAALPSPSQLETPAPTRPPLEEVHLDGLVRFAKALDEVKYRLVSTYNARLPYPQIPTKTFPVASATSRWLRAIRIQTTKAGQELKGLMIYYIGNGRASDRFPSKQLKSLGPSRFEDSVPWGNYLMIAAQGELPEIIERKMLKPVPIRLPSTPGVLQVDLEVK